MKYTRILLCLLVVLFGLSGCGANPSFKSPAEVNAVESNPQDWYLLYGSGTPVHPEALPAGAWSFDFPGTDGSVHYIEVPYAATEDLIGRTLTMTFQVVSRGAIYDANVEPNEGGHASIHLFIEHQDDDFTNDSYRWWCAASEYPLGSQDNQVHTVSCPLDYTAWS
jgi:hypothetical protein